MENSDIARIAASAVDTFGFKNQAKILQEECGELIVAASHYDRGRENAFENFVEELADVQIMIWQMSYALRADNVICEYIDKKMRRLDCKIAEHKHQI